jgi:hypothetical protein
VGISLFEFTTGGIYNFNYRSWHFFFQAGWFYKTMFVTKGLFGFNGLYGVDFGPVVSKDLNPKSNVGAYYKFASPLGTSGTNNLVQSMGLTWSQKISPVSQVDIRLDYSHINLSINTSIVSSSAWMLSFTYSGFSWAL